MGGDPLHVDGMAFSGDGKEAGLGPQSLAEIAVLSGPHGALPVPIVSWCILPLGGR